MIKPNKRCIYNFMIGLTISGFLISTACVAGEVVLTAQISNARNEIISDQLDLYSLNAEFLDSNFYNYKQSELDRVEHLKDSGVIDGVSFITETSYINSRQFEDEYLLKNHENIYNYQVLPKRHRVEQNKKKVDNLQRVSKELSIIGTTKLACSAYSSALLFSCKDFQKEL